MHQDREGRDRNVILTGFANIKTDMRNLRIGIGAPGDGQRAQPSRPKNKALPPRAARIGRVSESMLQANVTRRVNLAIAGLQEVVDANSGLSIVAHTAASRFMSSTFGARPMSDM